MKAVFQLVRHAARQVVAALLTFVLWMIWLALGGIAVAQIYIATRHELAVPAFVLRRLESRLDEAGLKAEFDRATFDPTGRIFVQSPRVFLPGFSDPVVTARGAYVGLSPWPALVGNFDVREIRLIDTTVLIPAMLSPSGSAQPIIRDVDALIVPGDKEIVLRHISGRVSGLIVSVHGRVAHVPGAPKRSPGQVASMIRTRFTDFCRVAVEFTRRLEAFEQPSLNLELEPSLTRGAIVAFDLVARGLKIDAPVSAELSRFRVTTHFPLLGDIPSVTRLDLTAEGLRLPGGIEVGRFTASVRGRVRPAELRVEPVELDIAAERVTTPDGNAETLSGVALPKESTRWTGELVGRLLDSPLGLDGEIDLKARTAQVHFAGAISPAVLKTVSGRTNVDVPKFFNFAALQCRTATAQFGPNWKFQRLSATVALRGINAHGVIMDDGYATVELDPQRFYSPDAYARIGDNFAYGTYEHIFATHEFRFLLRGRLRPLDIGEWFQSWWGNFFHRFEFPVAPPSASVDVHGFWREGRRTSVFVFADANAPVALGQKLNRVRTRLFIRPGFFDGLELFGVDLAGGTAKGTFCVKTNADSGDWRSIDFDGTTSVTLDVAAGIAGALSKPILSPFKLENAPLVVLRGHIEGPDITGKKRQELDLDARSTGSFRFYGLPFDEVAFTTRVRGDEFTIDATDGKFAGGSVRVHAKIWGAEPERHIGFDAMLDDASLGVAVAATQTFMAERKGLPPPPAGKFVQEKANVRVDVALSADGLYGNALSFRGGGNATMRGAEIGEVPLFGPLSELLKFTALRFTTARSSFKVNGAKVEFPDVTLRGANSAIDAHGEYALDRRQLDFRAKVFPFQESGSVIKTVVGAVLTPISNVLEVKLTGTLEKPEWAFVIGPTNFLRSLSQDEPQAGEAAPPSGPADGQKAVEKPRTPTEAAEPKPPAAPPTKVN